MQGAQLGTKTPGININNAVYVLTHCDKSFTPNCHKYMEDSIDFRTFYFAISLETFLPSSNNWAYLIKYEGFS